MRLALLTAAALGVAGAAWASAPSNRASDELLLKDPDWLAAPSFEARMRAFPQAALDAGLGGETALRCQVKTDGGITGCVLAGETPAGMGFGQAGLALADRFRLKPEAIPRSTSDHAAPEVQILIRWAIVEQPSWERTPSGGQLADLYPDGARSKGIPGLARIRCEVQTDGTLANCFTLVEAPQSMGFAAATLRAARYFRMKPTTSDGKPAAGSMVEIPIRWQVDGSALDVVQAGDGSVLIAVLKPGAKQSKYLELNCASAASKTQKCLLMPAPWLAQPPSSLVWDVMSRRHVETGVTWLSCQIGDNRAVHDCKARDKATPDQEAAMRELAAGLKAAPENSDGIPTSGQLVLVKFDWEQLRLAARPAPGARR